MPASTHRLRAPARPFFPTPTSTPTARWLALGLLGLLGLALSGCSETASAPGAAAAPPAPEVAVIEVQSAATALTVELPGRLEAQRTAQVRARPRGIV